MMDLAITSLLAISVQPSVTTVELLDGKAMTSGARKDDVLESLLPVNWICGRG